MAGGSISIAQVDAHLPQTQCGKCGHPGCQPYARAIIEQGEAINRCPPGGQETADALAAMLERPPLSLAQPAEFPLLAVIDEERCIGCTKCIQACPVDAILGAPKQMHSVFQRECTGCELCIMPCPVDCISMTAHPDWQAATEASAPQQWLSTRAERARQRHHARAERLTKLQQETLARQRARRRQHLAPQQQSSIAAVSPVDAAKQRRHLRIRLARMRQNDDERAALTAQLRHLEGADTTLPRSGQPSHQALRLALAAAEETLRRARQHLAHCQRQEGPEQIEAAQQQIVRAEQQWQQARELIHEQAP